MFTFLTNLTSVPCHAIFVGYPTCQKAYKLFDLSTKKVFTSRDVKFHEDIFPYVFLKPNSTFPSLTHNSGPIPLVPHDIPSSLDSFFWLYFSRTFLSSFRPHKHTVFSHRKWRPSFSFLTVWTRSLFFDAGTSPTLHSSYLYPKPKTFLLTKQSYPDRTFFSDRSKPSTIAFCNSNIAFSDVAIRIHPVCSSRPNVPLFTKNTLTWTSYSALATISPRRSSSTIMSAPTFALINLLSWFQVRPKVHDIH